MTERKPEEVIIPPVRLNELVVLMRCLEHEFESERTTASDKAPVKSMYSRAAANERNSRAAYLRLMGHDSQK